MDLSVFWCEYFHAPFSPSRPFPPVCPSFFLSHPSSIRPGILLNAARNPSMPSTLKFPFNSPLLGHSTKSVQTYSSALIRFSRVCALHRDRSSTTFVHVRSPTGLSCSPWLWFGLDLLAQWPRVVTWGTIAQQMKKEWRVYMLGGSDQWSFHRLAAVIAWSGL